jgi:hypothetical protein
MFPALNDFCASIMPVIVVIYFLQRKILITSYKPKFWKFYYLTVLDKQTLAFSSVFGLSIDTGLVGDQYSLLGSMV